MNVIVYGFLLLFTISMTLTHGKEDKRGKKVEKDTIFIDTFQNNSIFIIKDKEIDYE